MRLARNASICFALFLLLVLAAGCSDDSGSTPGPDSGMAQDGGQGVDARRQDGSQVTTPPNCEPLPQPDPQNEKITEVDPSQAGDLQSIVADAEPSDTILLADGTYNLDGSYLWIGSPNVTIRSASGNREAVILDGNYQTTEIITVAASGATIADITIRRAYTHPIHVIAVAGSDTLSTLIYNVHIVDPREQSIKINPSDPGWYIDNGVVACSHIELTDLGRPNVNPTSGGCYTGGVDAHQAWGWVIRDNIIEGFWCENGLSEHAVHLWKGCRDTIVERNFLFNNARGVGFGLSTDGDARTYNDDPCPGVTSYVGHYGGIIRNNFIFADDQGLFSSDEGFDCGICLWSACNAWVAHNTVVSTQGAFSSVEWRFGGSQGIQVVNNLVTDPLREREDASADLEGNLTDAPLSLFLDTSSKDLHLLSTAADAIDRGVVLPSGICDEDIDGQARDSSPDIGADELE